MDYSDRDLSNTSFSGQNLSEANFDNSILINVDFTASNLTAASFVNAHLANSNFANANLESSDFSQANLIDANLSRTNIRGCNFYRASLTNANFEQVTTGISWIKIFDLVYTALGNPLLDSDNNHDSRDKSVGNLFGLVVASTVIIYIFGKAIVPAYDNHDLFSLVAITSISLSCFVYLTHNFQQAINEIKQQSGTCFRCADLSNAKFHYALIADTDFSDAIITNIDWRNSKSKSDRDLI